MKTITTITTITTICLIILLASCSGNGTLQPTQLIHISKERKSYCYNLEKDIVLKRANNYFKKCFTNSVFGSDFLKVGNIPYGKRLSLSNGDVFQYSVEIKSNIHSCTTEAKMYGIDDDWKSAFNQTNNAILGKKFSCP